MHERRWDGWAVRERAGLMRVSRGWRSVAMATAVRWQVSEWAAAHLSGTPRRNCTASDIYRNTPNAKWLSHGLVYDQKACVWSRPSVLCCLAAVMVSAGIIDGREQEHQSGVEIWAGGVWFSLEMSIRTGSLQRSHMKERPSGGWSGLFQHVDFPNWSISDCGCCGLKCLWKRCSCLTLVMRFHVIPVLTKH